MADCDEVDGFRKRLKNWLKFKRPAKEDLIARGILKHEAVFGNTLNELFLQSGDHVPRFVTNAIEYVEQGDRILTEGIYRQSAVLSHVQKIRLQIDQNNYDAIKDCNEVHVITGSLKLFFRELQEPLIPWAVAKELQTINDEQGLNSTQSSEQIKNVLEGMPLPHLATLSVLLEHLRKVASNRNGNRMEILNLAIIFGPTLMWPPLAHMSHELTISLHKQSTVVELLLRNLNDIIDQDALREAIKEDLNSFSASGGVSKHKSLENLLRRSKNDLSWLTLPALTRPLTVDERFIVDEEAVRKKSVRGNFEPPFLVKRKIRCSESETWNDKLKNFLIRRPSIESLCEKGIIKPGAVFGSDLEKMAKVNQQLIPPFVKKCMEIMETEAFIQTEKIYSQTANMSQVQKLRFDINEGQLGALEKIRDPHVLCGALKMFFRELKKPLIPWDIFTHLYGLVSTQEEPNDEVKAVLKTSLSPAHYATLKKLLKHLTKVSEYKQFNHMDAKNLSIVFGPNITWSDSFSPESQRQQQMATEKLISMAHELIETKPKPLRTAPSTPLDAYTSPSPSPTTPSPSIPKTLASRLSRSIPNLNLQKMTTFQFGNRVGSIVRRPKKTQQEKDLEVMDKIAQDLRDF